MKKNHIPKFYRKSIQEKYVFRKISQPIYSFFHISSKHFYTIFDANNTFVVCFILQNLYNFNFTYVLLHLT